MSGDGWLVVGGAGYVGSHVVRALADASQRVVVLDDLSGGRPERLPGDVTLVVADGADGDSVARVLAEHGLLGVVHLAARKQAGESTRDPLGYWTRNVRAVLGVLEGISGSGARHLLLSSSCSVYGAAGPVTEESPLRPVSPYGRTKLVSEQAVADCAPSLGLTWMSLRYFNVVGNGEFAHAHDSSTECLVPAAYREIRAGRPPVVFGTDYATPDGTCLRDYVDVRDLARAHVLAVQALTDDAGRGALPTAIDVAVGRPSSVLEVMGHLHAEAGRPVTIHDAGRRPGDPEAVWSAGALAGSVLGWSPEHDLVSSVAAHVRSVRQWEEP